ncbi:MAG: Holliday junction branch migration protein RuvA [Pseudomonadota bacterium]
MIGFLRGRLAEKRPPDLVIDVGGVGYEVEAPMSTCADLPATGESIHLLTHLVVRDDAHVLFGFATEAERGLFRELIRVSKVGPKVALGILSGISVSDFAHCVEEGDTSRLTRLPGIGKKTAERLVVEMRDRLQGEATSSTFGVNLAGREALPADGRREAFEALLALGYKNAEASRMLKDLKVNGLDTAQIVRLALRG